AGSQTTPAFLRRLNPRILTWGIGLVGLGGKLQAPISKLQRSFKLQTSSSREASMLLRGIRKRLPVVLIALLVLLVAAAYLPVLRANFTNYDDPYYVSKNPAVLAGL